MSLRNLPEIDAASLPDICAFQPDPEAVDRWDGGILAEQSDENTITILDSIGEDWWTGGGVTSKRVAAALRSIGPGEVFVDINSPGGDFFEGVAIYNLLREHKGKVTVRVLGLAASAASLITMAGDEVRIGKAAFMMVHNAWVVAIGNRHDLQDVAEKLEPIDGAMAAVYADRSGADKGTVAKWMDAETWFNGEDAVGAGLADDFLSSDAITRDDEQAKAFDQLKPVMKAEFGLAKAGMSRQERRSLLGDIMGPANGLAAQRLAVADEQGIAKALEQLRSTIRS